MCIFSTAQSKPDPQSRTDEKTATAGRTGAVRGPVTPPQGSSCDDVEDLPDDQLRRLAKTGQWEQYHANGRVLAAGRYENDGRTGEWKQYDDEGQLLRVSNYADNKKHGPEVAYFPGTTQWKERGDYAEGKRTGIWEMRASVNSDCVSRGPYVLGDKDGEWQECGNDPETRQWYIQFRGNYSGGLRSGPGRTYYPNGQVQSEGEHWADTSDECRDSPPQGNPENCGKRTGFWKIYYPDGKLAMTGSYSRSTGLRTGTWTEYYRSGEKMAEGPREHVRNGTWTFWDKNGQILARFVFEDNEFVPARHEAYENGRKVAEGSVNVGLVKYNQETDALEFNVVRGGVWTFFDANGQSVAEGELMAGKKHGEWRERVNGRWVQNCYMLGRPTECLN